MRANDLQNLADLPELSGLALPRDLVDAATCSRVQWTLRTIGERNTF